MQSSVQEQTLRSTKPKSGGNPNAHKLIEKQNVVYSYTWLLFILFSHRKEWSIDTCYNTDDPWQHNAKWHKPDTKDKYCDSTYVKHLELANS